MQRDSMYRGNNNDSRLYVGNLPEDFREKDVEDLFYKFGEIADVTVKKSDPRRGDPRDRRRDDHGFAYAFVQFDDPRDAEEAVRKRDGYEVEGTRIRVEFTKSSSSSYRSSRGGGGGGGYRFQSRGGRGRGIPPKRSNNRVNVEGLPPTGSWQDLKDHMREAGEVFYAEVYGDGTGIVEFARRDESHYAAKNLDQTTFRSHEGESSVVSVHADSARGDHGRSRSRSRSRGRRSKSSSHGRYSRSRSPAYERTRSHSRSRSRSRSPQPY